MKIMGISALKAGKLGELGVSTSSVSRSYSFCKVSEDYLGGICGDGFNMLRAMCTLETDRGEYVEVFPVM
ncbi:MAG: hypothetical protein ACLUOI_03990 [Eisenbergiella sp.]